MMQQFIISEFYNMNGIYVVQRFALYFKFKWTEKEKKWRKQENTFCRNNNSKYWCAAMILMFFMGATDRRLRQLVLALFGEAQS